ncbi:hemolysin [Clostridium botulinum]|nr:hemolysin [Clostridium botulinum]MBY6923945.1 hemolysin [Clostridium botulinum]NFF84892.1 hemolysin [Clostridium botulinum]NFH16363.1 hemolysin [Clostridium botulinum]NFH43435.1 hemolysin [Clostridium botulinum]
MYEQWKCHEKFNKLEIKSDNEENNSTSDLNYKKVNIEDIPFL